jgi:hypothetical protein
MTPAGSEMREVFDYVFDRVLPLLLPARSPDVHKTSLDFLGAHTKDVPKVVELGIADLLLELL